jgi:hypothetical protein
MTFKGIEQVGLEVTPEAYIREVLGSNLGRNTGYFDSFRGFSVPSDKIRLVPRLGRYNFPPNLSRRSLSYHPTLYNPDIEKAP